MTKRISVLVLSILILGSLEWVGCSNSPSQITSPSSVAPELPSQAFRRRNHDVEYHDEVTDLIKAGDRHEIHRLLRENRLLSKKIEYILVAAEYGQTEILADLMDWYRLDRS